MAWQEIGGTAGSEDPGEHDAGDPKRLIVNSSPFFNPRCASGANGEHGAPGLANHMLRVGPVEHQLHAAGSLSAHDAEIRARPGGPQQDRAIGAVDRHDLVDVAPCLW